MATVLEFANINPNFWINIIAISITVLYTWWFILQISIFSHFHWWTIANVTLWWPWVHSFIHSVVFIMTSDKTHMKLRWMDG